LGLFCATTKNLAGIGEPQTTMNIFVTGASGFVGSEAVAMLAQKGHAVVGMSRSEKSDAFIQLKGGQPLRCDLNNIAAEHLNNIDLIIHSAAFVGEWGSYADFYAVNVQGTANLIKAAKAAGVKKIIHISTESVLFKGQDLVEVDETHPYPAHSPFHYSETKKLAEQMMVKAHENDGLQTICLRPRMIWGKNDQTLLPLIKTAIENKQFKWVDGGRRITSTTHINNLLHAIDLCLAANMGGEVFFVTDAENKSIKAFWSGILAANKIDAGNASFPSWLGKPIAFCIEKIWTIFQLKSRPPATRLSVAIFSCDCTIKSDKAKKMLGYQPVMSYEAGLKEFEE
jgi:nucleoside-diphosphate-sugar epimerase